jgi:hypothetical protein
MYSKLKRVWSHNNVNYIPNFQKVFPELNKIDSEELCDRFIELNIEFYCLEETPVKPWLRLTMPFAIVLMILMLLAIPFNYLITGKWSYSLGEKNTILNWFKALKLQ